MTDTARPHRSTPTLVLEIGLERSPQAFVVADSLEDELRLESWLSRAGSLAHLTVADVLHELARRS